MLVGAALLTANAAPAQATSASAAAPATPADAGVAGQPGWRHEEIVAGTAATPRPDEIVVTAQGRPGRIARTPVAVTVVGAARLQDSGVHDLRELTQLTPSLFLASSSTEAAGAAARIRGIGTVGDNAGLESSVATFVDGVYRARTGTALSELGAIDRIEVLEGPQSTLFGRNASAGVISIITAKPSFTERADLSATLGNYRERRLEGDVTGPLNSTLAYRLDGVWTKRRGFLTDDVSGRHINGRDRWLGRGQLLWQPSAAVSLRIIGDYAERKEECCAGVYLPAANRSLDPATGKIVETPSSIAGLIRGFGGSVEEDPFKRRTAITAGQSYRSDVTDKGLSGQLDADLGWARLTGIVAARGWRYIRGQDADFNSLDLLVRPDNGDARERFSTRTAELRLTGTTLGGRLDWLVGGYAAGEHLHLSDNLAYGSQFGLFFSCLVAGGAGGAAPGEPGCLAPAVRAGIGASAPGQTLLDGLDRLAAISSAGNGVDRYLQRERNAALFTHDVFKVTDRLLVTAGARYTREHKSLDADLNGSAVAAGTCLQNAASLAAIRDGAAYPAAFRSAASAIIGFSCVIAPIASAELSDSRSEGRWSGTANLSWQVTDRLMAYGGWSRGYKAFGYNLDRAALAVAAPSANQLRFKAETVSAWEVGAKYHSRALDLSAAAFDERFSDFQLNLFSGSNFIVASIEGCSALAGGDGADSDNVAGNGACTGHRKAGVISRGMEAAAELRPIDDVSLDAGITYARARYASNLTGVDGTPLPTGFFALPGRQLSSAPKVTATGSARWTPSLGGPLRGLAYADLRTQSAETPGTDLDPEKRQRAVAIVNARLGVSDERDGWSVELWAQNLFNKTYIQVGFDAPAQPGGAFNTVRGVASGYQATATQLFGAFLADPRTFGVTLRTRL